MGATIAGMYQGDRKSINTVSEIEFSTFLMSKILSIE